MNERSLMSVLMKLVRIIWILSSVYLLALSVYYKSWVLAAFVGWLWLVGFIFQKLDKRKTSLDH